MAESSRIYRERAAQCAEMAARAKTEESKSVLIQMSRAWETLAREAEVAEQMAEGMKTLKTG